MKLHTRLSKTLHELIRPLSADDGICFSYKHHMRGSEGDVVKVAVLGIPRLQTGHHDSVLERFDVFKRRVKGIGMWRFQNGCKDSC